MGRTSHECEYDKPSVSVRRRSEYDNGKKRDFSLECEDDRPSDKCECEPLAQWTWGFLTSHM